jgi:putative phage-type endonuclease
MKVIDCLQGSPEWLQARCGRVTSSRVADVLAKPKRGTGELQARANYRIELVSEILSNRVTEKYVSAEMLWGIEQEMFARTAYEIQRNTSVDLVGFVLHPEIERGGASPDGLVGDFGLVEFKCPKTNTHIGCLLDEVVPEDYQPQMLWQMACTERSWCDFVSYDPRLPEQYQLFVRRLMRDEARISEMEREARLFLGEVEDTVKKLRNRSSESSLYITEQDTVNA